jgi:L-ascorbate metabolism protein UlaG (beta-lactamase superfamily)
VRFRWLGWAGVEVEQDGVTVVIDPLRTARPVYQAVGDAADAVRFPPVVEPRQGRAAAALLTHLHRDHADAGALRHALAAGAPVLLPDADVARDTAADAALAQAHGELEAAGLPLRPATLWERVRIGPFELCAVPAADGTGDPQVSWIIAAGGHRVIHCGDTMFHGWWWRVAQALGPFDVAFLPINGAVVSFPWRRPASPLPAVMTPEQAAVAAAALRAQHAVPIHFDGFDLEPYYRSMPDALARFTGAAGALAAPAAVGEERAVARRAAASRS